MTTSQIGMLIFMILYLVAMLGVGFKFSKKNETVGDFYLGGRKLGPLVNSHERGGIGHEQLAADGAAWRWRI